MNTYSFAFAVGYFYGRAFNLNPDIVIPEQDMAYRTNLGFMHGLEAGRNDFREVDLPIIAMEQIPLFPVM